MPDTSPILDLPFLLPSQAQKHVTHNEALRRLDLVVQLRVAGFDATTPPEAPDEGEMHALGANPVAAWAGQAHALAAWLDGTWHFVAPQEGWRAWGKSEQQLRIWTGSAWALPQVPLENLPGLGIGTAADASNRLSVRAEATLLSHAGSDHRLKINKDGDADTASLLFQSGWTGHAEMGLSGDTDFAIKVSGDGSAWTDAIRFDATSGRASGAAIQDSPTDTTPGRLMRTDYGYSRGNILGPVAQSGGLPTGALIERGHNSGGHYARFADGTQICTRRFGGAATHHFWTFPAEFYPATGNDLAFTVMPRSSTVPIVVTESWDISPTGVSFKLWRTDGTPVSAQLFALAVGKWF